MGSDSHYSNTHESFPDNSQLDERVIRVFVSSTFQDMQEEREVLVKQIFPQLRKLCDHRGVAFTEIDLRWGITEEQSKQGKVLPICLAEIERCRPFFIGLLGQRYGWVPKDIPQELMDDQPWLAEHRHRSVTELEILHGVLNNPEMSNRALFYFRNPDSAKRSTDEDESANSEKLAALKQRIRNSELAISKKYDDPESLGQMILNDLTQVINQQFPPGTKPTELQRQAGEHEAFARSRAVRQSGDRQVGCYIGRQEYFDRIDAHVFGKGPPLVVLGESGLGKSALLANWAQRYSQSKPGKQVLLHFIGASADSANWAAMLRRILNEFQQRFDLEFEIPDDADGLRAAFKNALDIVSSRGGLVVIIDAFNQLDDQDGAPDLVWLPPVIPENVRLIVSTLSGRPLAELEKRGWPTLQIQPLTIDERKQLIREYLKQYVKQLSNEQIERIADCQQASNPLFLRALLEELRVFGTHERLDERIGYYLDVATIDDLHERILQRWEEDYEGNRPGLVRDAMSHLWAARRGLSETEMLELLGENGTPLPRAYWSPLFLAVEQSLTSKDGMINFFHDYVRQAVQDRYLPGESDCIQAHLKLADYFETQVARDRSDLKKRIIDEYPWQLCEGHSWRRLTLLLTELSNMAVLWNSNPFDLKAYWAKIEAHSEWNLKDVYLAVLDYHSTVEPAMYDIISRLFYDTGHLNEAIQLSEYLVQHFRQTGKQNELGSCLGKLAIALYKRGDLDEAMKLYDEQEQICREMEDLKGLQHVLGNKALILHDRGNLDGAQILLQEQGGLCHEMVNKKSLSYTLNTKAAIYYSRGDMKQAMQLYKEVEQICREEGNKDLLQNTLYNLANTLYMSGNPEEAMKLYREQEHICHEIGDKNGLVRSLFGQAVITQQDPGEQDDAMRLYQQAEQNCRETGYKEGLQYSLGNQALIQYDAGNIAEVLRLARDQEQICRDMGSIDGLAQALVSQGLALAKLGKPDEAISCAEQGYNLAVTNGLTTRAQRLKPLLGIVRRTATQN